GGGTGGHSGFRVEWTGGSRSERKSRRPESLPTPVRTGSGAKGLSQSRAERRDTPGFRSAKIHERRLGASSFTKSARESSWARGRSVELGGGTQRTLRRSRTGIASLMVS